MPRAERAFSAAAHTSRDTTSACARCRDAHVFVERASVSTAFNDAALLCRINAAFTRQMLCARIRVTVQRKDAASRYGDVLFGVRIATAECSCLSLRSHHARHACRPRHEAVDADARRAVSSGPRYRNACRTSAEKRAVMCPRVLQWPQRTLRQRTCRQRAARHVAINASHAHEVNDAIVCYCVRAIHCQRRDMRAHASARSRLCGECSHERVHVPPTV